MPLFEYRCRSCGRKTEELVLAGDTESAPVCACGSADLTRLLSTFAAHGVHKAESDFPCGDGACPEPDACGTGEAPCGMGACGMSGGFDGLD